MFLTSWKGEIKLKQKQKSTPFSQVRHEAFPRHMLETKVSFLPFLPCLDERDPGKRGTSAKKREEEWSPVMTWKGGEQILGACKQKKKRRRKRWEMMMSGGERKKASFSYFCNFRT